MIVLSEAFMGQVSRDCEIARWENLRNCHLSFFVIVRIVIFQRMCSIIEREVVNITFIVILMMMMMMMSPVPTWLIMNVKLWSELWGKCVGTCLGRSPTQFSHASQNSPLLAINVLEENAKSPSHRVQCWLLIE